MKTEIRVFASKIEMFW